MVSLQDRYQLDVELGRGGMGVVYLARDEKLGRNVAVKFLTGASHNTPESRARFRREALAAANLYHPGIVQLYDYIDEGGEPFIVLEYVEGTRLDTIIHDRKLTGEQVVELSSQLADALSYAHERKILHRDIKPQNIIVTPEGRAKILDFGLAKRTRENLLTCTTTTTGGGESFQTGMGTLVGTVQYMSPEQIAGDELDGRADVFSLGIVMYEMVAGSNPFVGGNVTSTIGKIMSPETPRFEPGSLPVSPRLQEIILRCLQKRKSDRYIGAKALAADLVRLKAGVDSEELSSAAPPALIPRALARTAMLLLQVMYLTLYAVAFVHLSDVTSTLNTLIREEINADAATVLRLGRFAMTVILATGSCGIAIRLFLIASVALDDPEAGLQFRRLFPVVFVFDEFWALSPLLLSGSWRLGVILLCMAPLAYVPITQLNLMKIAYPPRRRIPSVAGPS